MITSYKDLTIGKFQELRAIDATEPIDAQVAMISILADMDENVILDLPLNEYTKMVNGLDFLSKEPVITNKLPKSIKIKGNEYSVLKKVEDMTAGQFIDYQNYLADLENNLDFILSCFLIPKGKKYSNGYDVAEVAADIKEHLPIETALSMSAFFLKKWQSSTYAMLTYLDWKMKRTLKKMPTEEKEKIEKVRKEIHLLKSFLRNGVGYQA